MTVDDFIISSMSLNYNAYQANNYPTKRVREQLAKFHKSLPDRSTFHFNPCSTSLPLDFVDWSSLISLEYSENSSTAQFFCQFPSNQALIIKGSSSVVSDIFTSNLLSILNIHSAKYRLVQFSSSEFNQMLNNLQRVAIGDRYVESAILRELDRPFILLFEFIPSTYFLQMGKNRAKAFFAQDPMMGYRRCREIGEIIAADILINNDSRVPVIWNTEGNSSCFLVSLAANGLSEEVLVDGDSLVEFGHVMAVDTKVGTEMGGQQNSGMSERDKNAYLEKVDRFVRATIRDLDDALVGKTFGLLNLASLEGVKDFFYRSARVELDNFQLFQVLKGIMGTFREIADMSNEEIEEIFQELKQMVDEDWMDIWSRGLSSIPLDFIYEIKSTISNIVNSNEATFKWVYEMYKIDDSPLFF